MVPTKIAHTLGRMEGRMSHMESDLSEIRIKLVERVASLERWQAWIMGGWAALVALYAYVFKLTYYK
jgi:hypothetical protein